MVDLHLALCLPRGKLEGDKTWHCWWWQLVRQVLPGCYRWCFPLVWGWVKTYEITISLPYDYHIITIFGGSKPINIHEKPAIFSGSLWMPGPGPSAVDRGFTLLWPLGIRLVVAKKSADGGSGMEYQFFMCGKIKNTPNFMVYHDFPYKTCSLFNSLL